MASNQGGKAAFKRLRAFLHWLRTGEGFFPVHECPKPPAEADVIEAASAWSLANALLSKVEAHPQHGSRQVLKNLIGQIFQQSDGWLCADHLERQSAKKGNR